MSHRKTILETENPDQFLFHYTSMEVALEHILKDMQLKMGPYKATNDPRENKDWDFGVSAITLNGEFWDFAWPTWEAIDEIQKNLRIICLTTDACPDPSAAPPELRGYGRARMWAQYADNSTGVCLVFARESLSKSVSQAVVNPDKLWAETVKFEILSQAYEQDDRHRQAYDLDLNSVEDHGLARAMQNHVENYADILFFRKVEDWRDETEFCWVFSAEGGQGDIMIPIENSLVCVITGVHFPDVYYPSLDQLCRPGEKKVFRLFWYKGHLSGISERE